MILSTAIKRWAQKSRNHSVLPVTNVQNIARKALMFLRP